MKDIKKIGQHLRRIPWASAKQMTAEADALARKHIALMRDVLEHRSRTSGGSLLDAYADAQSAGNQAEGHLDFLRMLFKRIDYRSAPAKEPLVLTIASHFFWQDDPDMGHLDDPWAPLMKLYEMGYTSTFDQDDETGTLDVIIESKEGKKVYPLVSGGDLHEP